MITRARARASSPSTLEMEMRMPDRITLAGGSGVCLISPALLPIVFVKEQFN